MPYSYKDKKERIIKVEHLLQRQSPIKPLDPVRENTGLVRLTLAFRIAANSAPTSNPLRSSFRVWLLQDPNGTLIMVRFPSPPRARDLESFQLSNSPSTNAHLIPHVSNPERATYATFQRPAHIFAQMRGESIAQTRSINLAEH